MSKPKFVILFLLFSMALTLVAINWGQVSKDPRHPELIIFEGDAEESPADEIDMEPFPNAADAGSSY